jgi:hypothetical protein
VARYSRYKNTDISIIIRRHEVKWHSVMSCNVISFSSLLYRDRSSSCCISTAAPAGSPCMSAAATAIAQIASKPSQAILSGLAAFLACCCLVPFEATEWVRADIHSLGLLCRMLLLLVGTSCCSITWIDSTGTMFFNVLHVKSGLVLRSLPGPFMDRDACVCLQLIELPDVAKLLALPCCDFNKTLGSLLIFQIKECTNIRCNCNSKLL